MSTLAWLTSVPHPIELMLNPSSVCGAPYKKEMTDVPNRANAIHSYMLQHFPKLVNVPGLWVVGSTAYMLAENREPKGDLDLIAANKDTVYRVVSILDPGGGDVGVTYLGGARLVADGKQVDIWSLKSGQSIDDAINGFSATHPQARVAYELATGKLTVYPNDQVRQ